jgi:hypothetical protein
MTHVRWVSSFLKEILTADLEGEGKNRGKPIKVLINPLYRAQTPKYHAELKRLKSSGEITEAGLARV